MQNIKRIKKGTCNKIRPSSAGQCRIQVKVSPESNNISLSVRSITLKTETLSPGTNFICSISQSVTLPLPKKPFYTLFTAQHRAGNCTRRVLGQFSVQNGTCKFQKRALFLESIRAEKRAGVGIHNIGVRTLLSNPPPNMRITSWNLKTILIASPGTWGEINFGT